MRKSSKLPAIIGAVFIIAAGIAVYSVLNGANSTVTVMVAKKNLPAYTFVDSSDLNAVAVPSDSLGADDLTEADFEKKPGQKFVITSPVLQGQRVDTRYIPDSDSSSFAVVLPDERVVAASTTLSGIAQGTVRAGDVVDVNTGSNDGTSTATPASSFDKVLCVAASPTDCQGVLPPGVDLSGIDNSSNSTSYSTGNDLTVLMAVPEKDVSAVAGQTVTLALDPFCGIDSEGYFTSPRASQGADFLCQVPSDRLAAHAPSADKSTQSGSQQAG